MDDAEDGRALVEQRDADGPVRRALHEGARTVDRIDDPDEAVRQPLRIVDRFLGQPGGFRQQFGQPDPQKGVDADIRFGDGRSAALRPGPRGRRRARPEQLQGDRAGFQAAFTDGLQQLGRDR